MLEKNKDYVEMCVSSTDCAFTQNAATQITVDGYVYTTYMNIPDPGELYILISKEKFDQLQADNQHYHELAKQWEENYNLLLKKTGFDTIESLVFYLTNAGLCGTLLEALAKLRDREKYICSERDSERDRVKTLQEENEQLKKKLQVPDPFAEYKELFEKLQSKEDVEKFEWTLNHICGGRVSVNGWMVTAKLWRRNYETLSKLVGFSSVEEIQDYLTNEAECDTLQEAVSKLKDQVKYTCDEWYSANSRNNSWKAAAECNSPKELIEKIKGFREEIEMYYRLFKEWKTATGCPSPSAAKTLIESQASWCHAYHEVKGNNQKLADSIQKWKDMTKCETPEAAATWITSYESACGRGNNLAIEVEKWQKATGCETPEGAELNIRRLRGRIDEMKEFAAIASNWTDRIVED